MEKVDPESDFGIQKDVKSFSFSNPVLCLLDQDARIAQAKFKL